MSIDAGVDAWATLAQKALPHRTIVELLRAFGDPIAVLQASRTQLKSVVPEAAAIQVTPISLVHVMKWTRTQSNKLVFEAGFSLYDQEYTELYQPEVTGQSAKVWDANAIASNVVLSNPPPKISCTGRAAPCFTASFQRSDSGTIN